MPEIRHQSSAMANPLARPGPWQPPDGFAGIGIPDLQFHLPSVFSAPEHISHHRLRPIALAAFEY